jgi:hypothetical protein
MTTSAPNGASRFERPRYAPSTTKADWIAYSERLEAIVGRYEEALQRIVDHPIDEDKSAGWHFAAVRRIAREALRAPDNPSTASPRGSTFDPSAGGSRASVRSTPGSAAASRCNTSSARAGWRAGGGDAE